MDNDWLSTWSDKSFRPMAADAGAPYVLADPNSAAPFIDAPPVDGVVDRIELMRAQQQFLKEQLGPRSHRLEDLIGFHENPDGSLSIVPR